MSGNSSTTAGISTPSSTGGGNSTTSSGGAGIDEEFFRSCLQAMLRSDLNRDDKLDSVEYVRFVNSLFNESGTTFIAPLANLSSTFQSSFAEISSGGFIDVAGSKPSSLPTDAQLQHLNVICNTTQQVLVMYQQSLTLAPTVAPVVGNDVDVVLDQCISVLVAVDLDYNGVLSKDEYVLFVNQLMGLGDEGYLSFSLLNPEIQTNFATIISAQSGTNNGTNSSNSTNVANSSSISSFTGINIAGLGSSAGANGTPQQQPTTNAQELKQLTFVCTETQTILDKVEFEESDNLALCRISLASSDLNKDGWLQPAEYVYWLNLVLHDRYLGIPYSLLDTTLQEAYVQARNVTTKNPFNPYISIAGAESAVATMEQSQNLQSVCMIFFGVVDSVKQPTDKELELCFAVLQQLSVTTVELSEDKYISLVKNLSDPVWENVTYLDDLPFVLRDNYEWVKWGGYSVDLSVFNRVNEVSSLENQLRWICERTIVVGDSARDVIAKAASLHKLYMSSGSISSSSSSFLDFCTIPLLLSDVNADHALDQQEFCLLIDQLSGNAWIDLDCDELGLYMNQLFDSYSFYDDGDSSWKISINGSQPSVTPLSPSQVDYFRTFCAKAEDAVRVTRENSLYDQTCRVVLYLSDLDANGFLSRDEYAGFLFVLAGLYNGTNPTFDELDYEIQMFYNVLFIGLDGILAHENSAAGIDISKAFPGQTLDTMQELRLTTTCKTIKEAILSLKPPTPLPSDSTGRDNTIRVFNSFVVSNFKGLSAADLNGGFNRVGLKQAYIVFVEELFLQLTNNNSLQAPTNNTLGRCFDVITFAWHSSDVYLLSDAACPEGTGNKSYCSTAFAYFDVGMPAGGCSSHSEFEKISQDAIRNGVLQATLSRVDPRNDLTLLGVSYPVKPVVVVEPTQAVSRTSPAPVGLIVALVIVAILLCVVAFFAFRARSHIYTWIETLLGKVTSAREKQLDTQKPVDSIQESRSDPECSTYVDYYAKDINAPTALSGCTDQQLAHDPDFDFARGLFGSEMNFHQQPECFGERGNGGSTQCDVMDQFVQNLDDESASEQFEDEPGFSKKPSFSAMEEANVDSDDESASEQVDEPGLTKKSVFSAMDQANVDMTGQATNEVAYGVADEFLEVSSSEEIEDELSDSDHFSISGGASDQHASQTLQDFEDLFSSEGFEGQMSYSENSAYSAYSTLSAEEARGATIQSSQISEVKSASKEFDDDEPSFSERSVLSSTEENVASSHDYEEKSASEEFEDYASSSCSEEVSRTQHLSSFSAGGTTEASHENQIAHSMHCQEKFSVSPHNPNTNPDIASVVKIPGRSNGNSLQSTKTSTQKPMTRASETVAHPSRSSQSPSGRAQSQNSRPIKTNSPLKAVKGSSSNRTNSSVQKSSNQPSWDKRTSLYESTNGGAFLGSSPQNSMTKGHSQELRQLKTTSDHASKGESRVRSKMTQGNSAHSTNQSSLQQSTRGTQRSSQDQFQGESQQFRNSGEPSSRDEAHIQAKTSQGRSSQSTQKSRQPESRRR